MPSCRSLASAAALAALLSIPKLAAGTPVEELLRSVDGTRPLATIDAAGMPATTAVVDTTWIADWTFDAPGGGCTDAGWTMVDYRILNDGSNYWSINTSFAGTGGVVSKAAVLAKHDLTWVHDGYGSDWDYSIILLYRGTSTLKFSLVSDSEPCCDFVTVQTDSGGASEALVNYAHPNEGQDVAHLRDEIFRASGLQIASPLGPLALPDYGVPSVTHEVYIRFDSDGGWDDSDGQYLSFWKAGLIVDNIVVDGTPSGSGGYDYSENFEGALNANVTLANTAPAVPFGQWARVYPHATDNDPCGDHNLTCQWIFTDPTRGALSPSMAFGPGGTITPNWGDNIVVSPWVTLAGTLGPGASTILTFRFFGGNTYSRSRIRAGWAVRARVRVDNTDTPAPGDSVLLYTSWRHQNEWFSLNTYAWTTSSWDLTPYTGGAIEVQVRFRTADWQYALGVPPPSTLDPGPGPYLDRVRIGRLVPSGPRVEPIFATELAQDAFPSAVYTPSCGPAGPPVSYAATTDRFGTCDFSRSSPFMNGTCPTCFCVARYDSVGVSVEDLRGAGIADVSYYGAIVAGPHAGKAPPPWTVGANGFFRVPARLEGPCGGSCVRFWRVDLDDEYFRGGDVLYYLFTATDGLGGLTSYPPGLATAPTSISQAEAAVGGLIEVSFLPAIDWDPAYLARIAADPNGKLAPTPGEIANSSQRSCILYVNQTVDVPRSGPANRTAFLRTLDHLGYRDLCDVYDMNEHGSDAANNQLAGRATVEQATGYALIVQEEGWVPVGNAVEGYWPQTQWYRNYLARAPISEAGRAMLWLLGNDMARTTFAYSPTNPLLANDMGVTLASTSQPSRPNVVGQTSFTWADGSSTDFTGDLFALSGYYCPILYQYDGLGASGTAVVTHRYVLGGSPAAGAGVANANPALHWNTLLTSFNWRDIRDPQGSDPPGSQEDDLAASILNAVLPESCRAHANPTDIAGGRNFPSVARLYANFPNPFNPTTAIAFDLPRNGHVRLRIFDVAGRRVRTLLDGPSEAGRNRLLWNGLDESGRPVASGLYFYRLECPDLVATRKMILVR